MLMNFLVGFLNKGEFTSTTKRKDKSGTKHNKYDLSGLKANMSTIYNATADDNATSLQNYGNIEIFGGTSNIENADSNFNQHRKAVIRYVVETNLSTAIASFSSDKQFFDA